MESFCLSIERGGGKSHLPDDPHNARGTSTMATTTTTKRAMMASITAAMTSIMTSAMANDATMQMGKRGGDATMEGTAALTDPMLGVRGILYAVWISWCESEKKCNNKLVERVRLGEAFYKSQFE